VRTTHPGNIGATARAMKTMGLRHLSLVSPARFPGYEVTSRAANAVDVVEAATVTPELLDALAGCELVLGTTARPRRVEWPTVDPEQAAATIVNEARRGRRVAVVFGTERDGLSNTEVEYCHQLIRIPTGSSYASLNLAAAAQIIAYEIHKAAARHQVEAPPAGATRADPREMRHFYRHLQATLRDLDFIKVDHPPVKLMRKLVRLFNRARPEREELKVMRGILSAIQDNLKPGAGSRR